MQSVCLRMFKQSSVTILLIGRPLQKIVFDWFNSFGLTNDNGSYKYPWEPEFCHMFVITTPTCHKYKQRSAVADIITLT